MGHIDVTGRSMFKSMDHQGQYFGSLTPGASLRFANGHTEHPSGASRCWKVLNYYKNVKTSKMLFQERFALMMCSREMSSERATNGPCAKEAYFFERCQTYKSDTDVSYCFLFSFLILFRCTETRKLSTLTSISAI